MATYSYAQLEQLWINNGGPAAVAPVAAAVALAESSGRSDNNNYNDSNGRGGTQTSWGLWQISDGTHSQPVPNIDDPNVNAAQAVAKWRAEGNSFAPAWGTYTSGAYKAFLNGSTTPDPNVPAGGSGTASGATLAVSSSRCLVGGNTFIPCLLDASQARGIIGGMCLLSGAALFLVGIVLVVAQSGAPVRLPGPAGAAAKAVPSSPPPTYGLAPARSPSGAKYGVVPARSARRRTGP